MPTRNGRRCSVPFSTSSKVQAKSARFLQTAGTIPVGSCMSRLAVSLAIQTCRREVILLLRHQAAI